MYAKLGDEILPQYLNQKASYSISSGGTKKSRVQPNNGKRQ